MTIDSSTSYIDLITLDENENNIIVNRKDSFETEVGNETTIFGQIHKSFDANLVDINKPSFATRGLIDQRINEQTGELEFIKQNKFSFLSKKEYLSKIGVFYNYIEPFITNKELKVCLLLSPGIAFHSALLAINLIGAIPVVIHSTLSIDAIANGLCETCPDIVLLDQDSVKKFVKMTNGGMIEGLKSSLKLCILDNTNMAVKHRSSWETLVESIKKTVSDNTELVESKLLECECPEFKLPEAPKIVKAENDTVLIIYTSGTTADKGKGVLISNKNLVTGIKVVVDHTNTTTKLSKVNYLSFLPPAHMFEHLVSYLVLALDGIYAFGNARTISDKNTFCENGKPGGDISVFKPTTMCVVPLIIQRLKNAIETKVQQSGSISKSLYKYFKKSKCGGSVIGTWLGNKLIFNKISKKLGGNLECVISAGAALDDELKEWFENVCNVDVCEGYGLTESLATGFYSIPVLNTKRRCYVGVPSKTMSAKIDKEEVIEENGVKKIKGQLHLSGDTVVKSYLNAGMITDESGWFNTGDIAQIIVPLNKDKKKTDGKTLEQLHGVIRIMGRGKEQVKLSNGEFYNLADFENLYKNAEGIDNCMVCIGQTSSKPGLLVSTLSSTIEDQIRKEIERIEDKYNIRRGLRVGHISVVNDEWTPENDLITPTMKLKRLKIKQYYEKEFDYLTSV
eukprot:GAHX01000475.1.p1 GENE.GAHX01000475.1~~GAHX01000475.1.p1  ORF type:complete len:680 (+),score=133.37 GAHX01000475.1:39-2078(+)